TDHRPPTTDDDLSVTLSPCHLVTLSPCHEPGDPAHPPRPESASSERLDQTWLTQPALFAIEYALAKLWMSWGVQPQAMIGHSVGEFVAACLAGVFSLKEALHLVAGRARLVQEQPQGSMLAIRQAESQVKPLLKGNLSLAAVNSPFVC